MNETTATAAELRDSARQHFAESAESFARCDTDGFLSQWASDITGRKLMAQARIAEQGGRDEFPALFTTDGELVAAKLVDTRYGAAWGLLESDDPHSQFVGWFRESRAQNPATARRNDARKGFYVGTVLAPAKADIAGSGTGLAGAASCRVVHRRTDGGFSRDVEIVDNGH